MGSKSRRKGARFELAVAAAMGAARVSGMYRAGPDLEWNGRWIECKRFASGTEKLYRALDQDPDTSIVVHKADRRPVLISMRLDTFLDIVDEALAAGAGE